jgi:DNA-binding Lrp family transcriptional regulator
MTLDPVDRAIINRLQDGFPICDHPYREAAAELAIGEGELIERLGRLLHDGQLSRFGPMYHAERLGGGLSLCAMSIPPEELDGVSEQVNAFPEVAHNYARDHAFNMWFVVATETPDAIARVVRRIEHETGYPVYNLPKEKEFFIGLKFTV